MQRIKTSSVLNLITAEDEKKFAGTSDKSFFPFYAAPIGSTSLVRLLPNGNDDGTPNPEILPWVEKRTVRLTLDGAINTDNATTDPVVVAFTCNQTFGGKCKIQEAIKPLWTGSEEEKQVARQFYRKPSRIAQCLVVQSGFQEKETPQNPIRRLNMNKSIYEVVKTACGNLDFEDAVFDYEGGRDLKIIKTSQGQYANYGTSQFSYKTRALSKAELDAIELHGLANLETALGTPPSEEELELQYQLFLDALLGKPFDNERFGRHFRFYVQKDADPAPAVPPAIAEKIGAPAAAEPEPPRSEATAEIMAKVKRQAVAA